MTDRVLLLNKIEQSKYQLSVAERELYEALHEIRSAPRAHKTHVDATIESAFERLRDARQNLADLQGLLVPGGDDA